MVKVKICGITNLEDALFSYFAGAGALGFVFYKKSPRYIQPRQAKNISKILPKRILRVGVFVDEKMPTVRRIAREVRLDMLQFHGQESPAYCRKFKDYKVIKAFRIGKKEDLNKVLQYKTFAYLFDSFSKTSLGGTGKKFNWKILAQAARMKPVVFISGGLTSGNVIKAVSLLKPDWVDASSSLESSPGKKDHRKVKRFIQALS
ncbi:MAG TPA: phosphoribosylanthranilate isomerase [Candidatus Omnitrophota bacterium]|nr:phosphoribosylanthranilate isomerase [Candidatus Omnitrophota bacterium]HPT38620.1 phosphoribosylanthranilate isomerase [Candidatus Omnitrophota bacterium]